MDRRLRRCVIKSRVDFDGGEITRVKFQPARRGQIGGVKIAAPFLETPGAGAEPDFLLSGEVQIVRRIIGSRPEGSLARRRATRRHFWPVQLDWTGKLTTLRNAMKLSFRILFLPLLLCLAGSLPVSASVVFKPGEKTKFRAPGEEEMSGTAQQLFEQAQAAERRGNLSAAIKAYRQIVKKHPKDTLAPGSCYRLAQLLEQTNKY